MNQDLNQVFSLLAMQEGKATPAQLAEAARQHPDDLGRHLVSAGTLSEAERVTIEMQAQSLLKEHGGDPAATIQSLAANMQTMSSSIFADAHATRPTDPEVKAKLDTMGASLARPGSVVPAVKEHEQRYTLLKEYSKGGMGKILLVRDEHLGRDIALKQLLPDRLPGGTRTGAPTAEMLTVPIIARFLQEARITGQLEHPSIVPVYELGYRDDGSLYYTMKFVRGRTLQDVLEEKAGLRERLPLLTHFLDLCQAIAYAHDRGVIHRDIKPLNVMIGEFGETVVIDWGIAKLRGHQDIHANDLKESVQVLRMGDTSATAKTVYGQTIGSPYYMPPEQAEGRTDAVDERSDVYALGAVLYTILTGQTPYSGSTVREFLKKVTEFAPRPVRELEPNAPPELAAVCAKAMARAQEERYPSAKELTAEIEKYLAGGLVSAYEYRFSELLKRFIRRHRTLLSTSAVAAAALLALGVYSYIRVTQERDYAVVQEKIAVDERGKAEKARDEAVEARAQEAVARERAQRKLYFANIGLAQRSIQERQMAQARTLLEECPAPFRNWEWGHLEALCNADLMTLKAGGRSVAFAGAGGILTGSAAGTISLYNAENGALVRTFVEKCGAGYAVACSADGARVAASGEKAVSVWNCETGEELLHFEETQAPLARNFVALSADGRYVAALNSDKTARVWEVGKSEALLSVPVKQAQGFGLCFAPANDRLLVLKAEFGGAGWVRGFEVLGIPSGEPMGKGEVRDPLSVHAAAFSADGARLALGTDEGLQLYEVSPWKQGKEYPARFGQPDTLAFSPDGTWVAGGTIDGTVALWNVATGETVEAVKAHQDQVRAVAFSHDGKVIATASFDRTIRLWSAPGLEARRTLRGHDKSLFAVAFNGDDTRLASGGFDGCTRVWDLHSTMESTPLEEVAFHPGTGRLAGATGNRIGVWESHSGRPLQSFESPENKIVALGFDGPGGLLVSVGRGQGDTDQLRAWDLERGAAQWNAAVPASNLPPVFGGSVVGVRGAAGWTFRDVANGEERWNLPVPGQGAFSPDGACFAVAGKDPASKEKFAVKVSLWKSSQREELGSFTLDTNYGAGISVGVRLAFSPDGKRIGVGTQYKTSESESTGMIQIWNVAEGAAGPLLKGHKSQVSCVLFSGDGTTLATGGGDSMIILWDLSTGAARLTLKGHANTIVDLAFSPDGKRLASASQDGTFKLWDTEDGSEFLTLQASAATARGQVVMPARVVFSGDARRLATLTSPPYPPMLLHAFPWAAEAYPGGPEVPFQERVEAVKRAYWR